MTSPDADPGEEREPVRVKDNRKIDRDPPPVAQAAEDESPHSSSAPGPADDAPDANDASSEPDETAALLEERTKDLQRLSAEYANYRKRAERERLAAGDYAAGRVLAELLPIADDLERAKAHGDLTGPLKAVGDKLDGVFAKLELVAFGEVGDRFDPEQHEAVLHDESDEVTVPTCTTVMRRGYKLKDRLLRPAMVGVSDPAGAPAPESEQTADPVQDPEPASDD